MWEWMVCSWWTCKINCSSMMSGPGLTPESMPRYEQIGRLTGVSTPPFAVVHRAEVLKMKHMVMEYMESVLAMQKQLKANGTITEGNTGGITTGITEGLTTG